MRNRLTATRLTRIVRLTAVPALALAAAVGCDEKPKPPPAVVEAAERPAPAPDVPAEPPRPTTQQIVDGPRRTVSLQAVPFALRVPVTWEVKADAGRTVLTGPAPGGGDVTVLLATRPATTAERIALLEAGAKKDVVADPRRHRAATLTKLGDVQVFERQQLDATPPGQDSPPLRWTITAFAPRPDKSFVPFELNFIGLTVKQYEAHEAFFRSVAGSLAYEPDRDTGT
jgi:hypothetical protein